MIVSMPFENAPPLPPFSVRVSKFPSFFVLCLASPSPNYQYHEASSHPAPLITHPATPLTCARKVTSCKTRAGQLPPPTPQRKMAATHTRHTNPSPHHERRVPLDSGYRHDAAAAALVGRADGGGRRGRAVGGGDGGGLGDGDVELLLGLQHRHHIRELGLGADLALFVAVWAGGGGVVACVKPCEASGSGSWCTYST
jgi:hypothetical protein